MREEYGRDAEEKCVFATSLSHVRVVNLRRVKYTFRFVAGSENGHVTCRRSVAPVKSYACEHAWKKIAKFILKFHVLFSIFEICNFQQFFIAIESLQPWYFDYNRRIKREPRFYIESENRLVDVSKGRVFSRNSISAQTFSLSGLKSYWITCSITSFRHAVDYWRLKAGERNDGWWPAGSFNTFFFFFPPFFYFCYPANGTML